MCNLDRKPPELCFGGSACGDGRPFNLNLAEASCPQPGHSRTTELNQSPRREPSQPAKGETGEEEEEKEEEEGFRSS